MFDGFLRRRNFPPNEVERPIIVLFLTGTPGLFTPVVADLNRLPFEADDGATECGGSIPTPWMWEDLDPTALSTIRSGIRRR
jgi:hypothetical protein